MATPKNTRRPAPRYTNAPRWNGPMVQIMPNAQLYADVLKAFNNKKDELAGFFRKFVQERTRVTGWRKISDISSTDSRKPAKEGEEQGEELEERFSSLTATFASRVKRLTGGELELTRPQTLGVIAAMAQDPELQAMGLNFASTLNNRQDGMTFSLWIPGVQGIPEDAAALDERLG